MVSEEAARGRGTLPPSGLDWSHDSLSQLVISALAFSVVAGPLRSGNEVEAASRD